MSDSNYKVALGLLLKSIQDGEPKHEIVLELGPTPKILIERGSLPELPLVIKGKVIDKVHFDHGITRGMLERLIDIACAPTSIYKCDPKHLPGCVLITTEVHRSNPVIVVIQREKTMGRDQFANEVASIYSKSGDFEKRWREEGLLLWKK